MEKAIYICPKRAAKKMKLAEDRNRPVYIYGAAGAGKTSFVKAYLGRGQYKYYSGSNISAGDISCKENGRRYIVVIDDLHAVAGQKPRERLYPVLERLAKQENVWLILAARCPMPRWLMPLYAQWSFCVMEEQELFFTIEEQEQYFEKWNLELTDETMEKIWQKSRGLPLYVKMAAMELQRVSQSGAALDKEAAERRCLEQADKNMRDYLDACVCGQWEAELQEFLMELSVVEQFDMPMAEAITGRQDAEGLMEQAREAGVFFAEDRQLCRFCSPLRDVLLSRLKRTRGAGRVRQLCRSAAVCLELRGQISEAIKLYEFCGDGESVFRILYDRAGENLSEGQYVELGGYYQKLEESAVKNSGILMAVMSMLCSNLMQEEESERWYRLLKEYGRHQEEYGAKEARLLLAYLDIALPHRGTVRMADMKRYVALMAEEGEIKMPKLPVTDSLPSQIDGGKDYCRWSRWDKELEKAAGSHWESVLGNAGRAVVSLALAESYFEKGRDDYVTAVWAERGRLQAELAGHLEQYFVAVHILARLSLLDGHAGDAGELLESFERRAREAAPCLLPNIRALKCRIALYQGDAGKILEWQREAPDENEKFSVRDRFRYLTKVRLYLYQGKYSQAVGLLHRLLCYARKMHRIYVEMESEMLLAIALEHIGNQAWKEELQRCVSTAEKLHFVRIISGGVEKF